MAAALGSLVFVPASSLARGALLIASSVESRQFRFTSDWERSQATRQSGDPDLVPAQTPRISYWLFSFLDSPFSTCDESAKRSSTSPYEVRTKLLSQLQACLGNARSFWAVPPYPESQRPPAVRAKFISCIAILRIDRGNFAPVFDATFVSSGGFPRIWEGLNRVHFCQIFAS